MGFLSFASSVPQFMEAGSWGPKIHFFDLQIHQQCVTNITADVDGHARLILTPNIQSKKHL